MARSGSATRITASTPITKAASRRPNCRPPCTRLDPRDGDLSVVADDFAGPNGLAFSPDERLLYVAESESAIRRRPGAPHPRLRCCGGRVAPVEWPGVPQVSRRVSLRRIPPRSGRQCLEQCRRRRALHRPRRYRPRPDQSAVHRVQPHLRRPPPLTACSICASHTLFAIYNQPARCPVALMRDPAGGGTLRPARRAPRTDDRACPADPGSRSYRARGAARHPTTPC